MAVDGDDHRQRRLDDGAQQSGHLPGLLGGRLGVYRTGLADGSIAAALVRNVWRGHAPDAPALAHVEAALLALRDSLAKTPVAALAAGELPE